MYKRQPQWAGSCWYYLRYLDPENTERFVSREAEQYWMGSTGNPGGVDLYVGCLLYTSCSEKTCGQSRKFLRLPHEQADGGRTLF